MGALVKLKKILIANTVNISVLFVALINTVLLLLFLDIYNSYSKLTQISIWVTIMILESVFVMYFINIFYKIPVTNLVYNIKKALLTKEQINLQKSINPDISYINNFFLQFLNSFKNIKSDFLKWKEIKWEVELAKEIQEKLLNKKITPPPSLNIVARAKPMWEIWWDSYDVIQSWDNFYMYVWDATWHWVWAWFIMVMVNALISSLTKVFVSWAPILAKVNEVLKPRVKANLLMTLLLVRWNEKDKRLFMTWAWHEHLIIYKDKLKKCFKIKSGWLALGMIKDIEKMIKEQEIKFEENDIIVLYSDGITDSVNSRDTSEIKERFWETRLTQAIESAPKAKWKEYKTAISVFNNITIELSKFMWYKHFQVDDMTLATIQYKPKDYDLNNDFSTEISEEFITEWKW